MSDVVEATKQLEYELRADGYKGTQRVMRLLKVFREALEARGYSFSEPTKETSSE